LEGLLITSVVIEEGAARVVIPWFLLIQLIFRPLDQIGSVEEGVGITTPLPLIETDLLKLGVAGPLLYFDR